MTVIPFLPYAKQSLDAADLEAVTQALSQPWITRGPQVEAFEQEMALYCGANYAVAFSSASAALAAAYFAAEMGPHDRLITTPNTFISTVGTGIQQGAMPVFIDIDRKSGNSDIQQLAWTANLSHSRGKPFLVPVHFSGIPVDMERLNHLLTNPQAIIIEDAAHALGSHYYKGGPKIGSCYWSQMTIFSFHPAKTITTGEGGLATTNDKKLMQRLRLYRNNGIERDPLFLEQPPAPWYYEVVNLSNNYNFTEFQAALGRSQLKRLPSFVAKRQKLMQTYYQKLKDVPHVRFFEAVNEEHIGFHLCTVQIDFQAYGTTRTKVIEQLNAKGIGTQMHYIPLYHHPYLKKAYGDLTAFFPETEAYYAQALSLPLYYDLSIKDVERVVKELKSCLKLTPR